MRLFAIALTVMVFFAAGVTNTHAQKLYISRHAEKVPQWQNGNFDDLHPLSAKGVQTSERLAKHFKKGSLTATGVL